MRVAFIKQPPALGFMATDEAILRLDHAVDVVAYPGRPTWSFLRDCWRIAGDADVAYTFFAAEQALLGGVLFRLRGKRLVVAVGGYDTANDPAHGYGLAANRRRWVPATVGRLAHRLVAHSAFAEDELLRGHPALADKASWAHLAVEPDRWPDPGVDREQDLVVTVASVSRTSFSRKGIDRFLAAAAADPGRRYVLAGPVAADAEALLANRPANLTVTGALTHDDLNQLLWRSNVYVQLSWHETFGMALIEAMLCGCAAVISDQPALDEAAGRWAVRSDGDDVAAVGRAAACRAEDRVAQRVDVAQRFGVQRRRTALADALSPAG